MVLFRCAYALLLLGALPCAAQKPLIFDVSTVVVGSQRLETLWAFAEGKWSDAGPNVGINSTDIHCYKRFGFCEVANDAKGGGGVRDRQSQRLDALAQHDASGVGWVFHRHGSFSLSSGNRHSQHPPRRHRSEKSLASLPERSRPKSLSS
jgi:hypothetical protein